MKFLILLILNFNLYASWNKKKEDSVTKDVRFALWGGSSDINSWIDSYVTTELKKLNINLIRVPLSDTQIAVKKILTDKKLGRASGKIDLIWINGENFKALKNSDALLKGILDVVPNKKFLNLEDKNITYDFGEKIESLEIPWGQAQMVMIYDSAKIDQPPKNLKELKDWIIKNPGRFTYPSPPDFTGSAFLRLILANIVPENEKKNKNDEKIVKENLPQTLNFLQEIAPYLYRKGEYYPESISKVHNLYSDGKLWLTMDYYPMSAQRMINKGVFPKSTKTFVFEKTLANTHYLAIPFNSAEKDSALKVANFLISPKAQASKMALKNWGDLPSISLAKLSSSEKKIFNDIEIGDATLPPEKLEMARTSELPASFIPLFENSWKEKVLKK